ncbi:MAG: DUF4422 domain-containing protein, partial [Lachnospiraceae bacterium]|nr:DUF4422 domain-containing protein [Lachnospiraceae bacterium]
MKTEIFVMTHKKCSLPNIPGYRRMQVGSALHEDLGYLRDDEGEDHISDLNVYYAELTGVYSLWRNLPDADYIGICHYRRYFINERKQIMVMGEFEKLLENADIVAAVADLDAPFQALYERAHYIEDLEAVGEAIQSLYPDDYPFFHEILQEKRCTYGNLCVMHRHLFEEYCTWLFDILSEAGENIDLGKFADDHQKKVFGFLGEPLLWVYIRARGLRMKECKAAFFDEKVETAELKNAIRVLTREGRYGEALEMYKEVILLRPDLVYRESDLNGELADMIDVIQKLNEESKLGKSDLYDLSHELDDLIHIDHKCCILVKGVLPILDYLADSYADGLKQSGYEVYFLDYQDFETSAKRILSLVSRKIDYVLAFNNVGFVLEKKDGTNLWEEKEIPAYNVLVDHPMYYADTLDNAPKNGVVLCADDSHPTYIARFYPSVGRSFFLPTGGTLKIAYEKQPIFAQRSIEFLMIGN